MPDLSTGRKSDTMQWLQYFCMYFQLYSTHRHRIPITTTTTTTTTTAATTCLHFGKIFLRRTVSYQSIWL